MKLFEPLEVREATVHAAMGGQALHRHRFRGGSVVELLPGEVD